MTGEHHARSWLTAPVLAVAALQEGVFLEALWWEGRFHDAIAMSMLAPEWERQVGR